MDKDNIDIHSDLVFASSTRVDKHAELVKDLFAKVLGVDYDTVIVTDRSSFFDYCALQHPEGDELDFEEFQEHVRSMIGRFWSVDPAQLDKDLLVCEIVEYISEVK